MAEESGEGFAWQQAGKSLRAIHKRRLSRMGGGGATEKDATTL